MKKLVLVLGAILLLAGCNEQSVIEVEDDTVRFAGLKGSVSIITDNQTGCKYIRESYGSGYSQAIGLTVLLKSDGTPDCD